MEIYAVTMEYRPDEEDGRFYFLGVALKFKNAVKILNKNKPELTDELKVSDMNEPDMKSSTYYYYDFKEDWVGNIEHITVEK